MVLKGQKEMLILYRMELQSIFTLFLLFITMNMYFILSKKYYFGWIRTVKSNI